MEQVKKLKVIWLCHFSNPEIRKHYPRKVKRPLYHFMRKLLHLPYKNGAPKDFAPWVTNGINELIKRKDVDLHVISPQTDLKRRLFEFELHGVHYYFYNPNWTLFLMHVVKSNGLWRKLQNSSHYANMFIHRINPDIINLIGAENPYHACTVLDIKHNAPVMVSLQTIFTNPDRIKYDSNADKSKNWYIDKLIHEKLSYFGATGRMHRDLLLKDNPNAIVFDFNWCSGTMPQVKSENKQFDFVNFAMGQSEKKGSHDSIKALSIVKQKYPGVKLNLVGNCDEKTKNELVKLIQQYDLINNVIFTSFFEKQADMFQHIQKSRFALLPCKMDITSGTMLQAMYYELPLVVYKTCGTPKFNLNKESALIAPLNDVEALAQNMLVLMDNPEKAEEIRRNAKEYITEHFDSKKATEKLIADYHAIIANFKYGTPIPEELLFNIDDNPIFE